MIAQAAPPVRLPDMRRASRSELHFFGGPYVVLDGHRQEVPEGSKRLLAFVALRRRRVERRQAAGELWPTGDDGRAAGNLRSALWRLRGAGIDLVQADKCSLMLEKHVTVDLEVAGGWASRLLTGTHSNEDLVASPFWSDALDLLPGWYDDWAVMERERVRQRMLHALENLSRRLVESRRYAEAIDVAMLAIGVEPLRESAQRVLLEAHLAEGNYVEARRCVFAYRDLLDRELGIGLSGDLEALISPDRD